MGIINAYLSILDEDEDEDEDMENNDIVNFLIRLYIMYGFEHTREPGR